MREEALANRAIAARDLQVAQIRLVLLPDLPLEAVTAPGAGAIAATAAVTGATVATGVAAGVSAIVTRTQRLIRRRRPDAPRWRPGRGRRGARPAAARPRRGRAAPTDPEGRDAPL